MLVQTPSGSVSALYKHIGEQTHVLIAGTTGSGKSVTTRGILNTLLYRPFCNLEGSTEFILIDPKGTELTDYAKTKHCIRYASAMIPGDMLSALQLAEKITTSRFAEMQRDPNRMDARHYYKGSDVWVVIDELADLMTTHGREVKPIIQRIGQIGRASRVHLLCCTQCPLAKVIPTEIKVNFDTVLALRTRSAQDSRNIIGTKGAELFPRYGKALLQSPDVMGIPEVDLPYVTEQETSTLVNHWQMQTTHTTKPGIFSRIKRMLVGA